MFKVSDYMKANAVTVSPSETISAVVSLMVQNKTNGVVVTEAEKVVGILSSWDLIEKIVPDYLELDKHLAAFESADIFVKRVGEVANSAVRSIMTTPVQTVRQDDSIMKAAALLSEFHIRQLPVVDESNLLVGYINRTDIKQAIFDALNQQ